LKSLVVLHILNIVFAFVTSLSQTNRILKSGSENNFRNSLLLICLAIFAAITSIIQTKRIIDKITNKITSPTQ
jgi:hypothetical protein